MDDKLKEIYKYQYWRQRIPLKDNLHTPGVIQSDLWQLLNLPESLVGKSFLDIGANDGMFSFIAEKKGAAKVVGSDLYKSTIDSMKNGWSSVGIKMLIDFFESKVTIHDKGVYDLKSINQSFDVVLMNDIINWLDDVESAIENIGVVTNGRLYLSDGFINDLKASKKAKQVGPSLRYMYTVPFITDLLKKNGFKIVSITPLNYQPVFLNEYINTPVLDIAENTPYYSLPNGEEMIGSFAKQLHTKADGEMNGYFHVYKNGWVDKNQVQVKFNSPSKYYAVAKRLGFMNLYLHLQNIRYQKQTNIAAFQIVAEK